MRALAVTAGEAAGIGPEITCKAWAMREAEGLPPFFVLGDPARLQAASDALGAAAPVTVIASPEEAAAYFAEALPVLPLSGAFRALPGAPDLADQKLVVEAVERAVDLCMVGAAAAMVTNPVCKAWLREAGFPHPGHTELIGERCGAAQPVMLLAGPNLKVTPATIHCALSEAVTQLSGDLLLRIGRELAAALRKDFGIDDPVIAVAGLNPHAGEDGVMGAEEREIIAPAIARLQDEGVCAKGPFAADSMFHRAARATYDAAICMYHDQALIPAKTLDFDATVNVTLGLPLIRTSPDHGVAFDIAGKGVARPDSLIAAIRLAAEIAHRRAAASAAR